MALRGADNAEKIWNRLISEGFSECGTAGLMGNLYAESALNPKNLQNTYEKSLGYTDDGYTAAVDSGSYGNFVRDSAGYGLAQWTYWSRKQNLLTFARAAGKSIGDLEMQLDFLCKELKENYGVLYGSLKTASNVRIASDNVLLNFEKPADQGESVKIKRAGYGQKYYTKFADKKTGTGGNSMGNSSLVDCTVKSPNHSGKRTHAVDRITPHCVVGQLLAESIGGCFTSSSVQASCNYGIGKDGRVCLIVDEANRSWCSSSNANDQRAITIECASDMEEPYAMTNAVYEKLIELCVDICKRYGKKKLLWFADKTKSLNYSPKSDEMVLTVHRWFANKSCPGNWLYSRLGDVANRVTSQLGGGTGSTGGTVSSGEMYRVRKTWADAKSQKGAFTILDNAKKCADQNKGYSVFNGEGNKVYPTTTGSSGGAGKASYEVGKTYTTQVDALRVRTGAGTNYAAKSYGQLTANARQNADSSGCLRKGTKVTCQAVKNVGSDIWIKIPSGWIAAYYSGKKYVG